MDDASDSAQVWWVPTLIGVMSLAVGIVAVADPSIGVRALGVIVGLYLLLAGISQLLKGLRGEATQRVVDLVFGALAVVGGVVCLFGPDGKLLALVIGVYLVLAGASSLAAASVDPERRGGLLIAAFIYLPLGVAVLVWGHDSLKTLAVLAGICLILNGIVMIFGSLVVRAMRDDAQPPPNSAAA